MVTVPNWTNFLSSSHSSHSFSLSLEMSQNPPLLRVLLVTFFSLLTISHSSSFTLVMHFQLVFSSTSSEISVFIHVAEDGFDTHSGFVRVCVFPGIFLYSVPCKFFFPFFHFSFVDFPSFWPSLFFVGLFFCRRGMPSFFLFLLFSLGRQALAIRTPFIFTASLSCLWLSSDLVISSFSSSLPFLFKFF